MIVAETTPSLPFQFRGSLVLAARQFPRNRAATQDRPRARRFGTSSQSICGSVDTNAGGGAILLYSIAAAVIGGTSLFGGRGRISDAVTGGLVVAIIANGLPLVTEKSGVQFIVNGLVLLLAASVDAISRRRAAATGR